MKKILLLGFVVSVITFFLCSCNNNQNLNMKNNVGNNMENSQSISEIEKVEVGAKVPSFTCETNKDKIFDIEKTDKPVLINFWATW